MAASTRSSVIPRRTICSSTMRARSRSNAVLTAPAVMTLHLRVERGAPLRHPRERRVVGEVEVQRRHGDVALVDRAHVGAFERFPGGIAAAEPVVRATARIALLDD